MERDQIDMPRTAIQPGFNLVTGSYLGNGGDNRNIEVGFRPQLIIVKSSAASYGVFRTTEMPTNNASYLSNAAANLVNTIQDFFDKGFIIGTAAEVNSASVVYHWVAMSAGNTNDFATFSYVGTGATKQVALTFQPTAVFIKRNGASSLKFKTDVSVTTASHSIGAVANDSDAITALTTTGFTLSTSVGVNNSGDTFYGFALKNSGVGLFKTGLYTGNSSDDRSITGVGFAPDLVFVKNITNANINSWRVRHKTFVGDIASNYSNSTLASLSNSLQALQSDGFQTGTNAGANENTSSFQYIAFKEHRIREVIS